jgi:hypothetical protein
VLDIDKKDHPDTDLEVLKAKMKRWRYTFVCFSSPSGGLKLVINTGIHDKAQHAGYFNSLCKLVKNNFPEITKIDGTGRNIARACYLPHDDEAYINTKAKAYELSSIEVEQLTSEHKNNQDPLHVVLHIDNLPIEDHVDNLINLIKNRTSVGYFSQLRICTEREIVESHRTLVGNTNTFIGTSVGYYDDIFNKYRFKNIEKGVMRTDVPILYLLIMQLSYPYKLDFNTFLDESYFSTRTQTKINILDLGNHDGLKTCEIKEFSRGIKTGTRHRTIASMSMKLIYNNPLCHPRRC